MKDRNKSNQRMIDHIKSKQGSLSDQKEQELQNVEPDQVRNLELVKQYNTQIKDLNPKYAKLKMLNSVLVRCLAVEPVFVDGIFQPQPTIVEVNTANGIRSHMDINKVGYDFKAIVVSAPEFSNFKQGDIVILDPSVIVPKVVGNPQFGLTQVISSQFFYPDGKSVNIVQPDIKDESYGYIKVQPSSIVAVMPDVE